MLLTIPETAGKKATYFPARILLGSAIKPERDTHLFAPAIELARKRRWPAKIHLLLDDAARKWDVGNIIQFMVSTQRTDVKFFGIGMVKNVQNVTLSTDGVQLFVRIAGRVLEGAEVVLFYQNEGFDSVDDFYAWFMPTVVQNGGSKNYRLIIWNDFIY